MELSGGCTKNGTCPLVPRNQIPVDPTYAGPAGGCTRNGTCPLIPWNQNQYRDASDVEPQGGCTRNGTCPLVPRNQIPVDPTYAEPSDGCTRNGTCPLIPRYQNWHMQVSDLEPHVGCTKNGTCPLVPRNQNIVAPTTGGCTLNGTCPLVPWNQNRNRNISDVEPQGWCTRNGTCPLVPRNETLVSPTFAEPTDGCTRNGTCPLIPGNHNWHMNVSHLEPHGGCTKNGTCPLVPRNRNRQVFPTNGEIAVGCTRNGTCPLVPQNQNRFVNISDVGPQVQCTRNGTCPHVPKEWIVQNDAECTFEEICYGNGARPYRRGNPTGDFSSQKRNGGCTVNGTYTLRPQQHYWIKNDFQHDRLPQTQIWNYADANPENTRNGMRPKRHRNQNWHQNFVDLELMRECTCPLPGKLFEAGDIETKLCNTKILRPWKPRIHFWHLTASDMEMNGGCTKNECPIIRCKHKCARPIGRCCPGYTKNAMYIFKTNDQIWLVDARDIGLTEDCMTNGMSPVKTPFEFQCQFDSVKATPDEFCNGKRDTTMTGNCNMRPGNAFQHDEQCECTFCRVQYRPQYLPIVPQPMGETQCGRNGKSRPLPNLARQNCGRCNGLDNIAPTKECGMYNCNLPQKRKYNVWFPQTDAETWNANTTCMRAARKQYWENPDTKNVFRCPGGCVCAANPLKCNRAKTKPRILHLRNRTSLRRQKWPLISHNSTKDELFIQSHQY